MVDRLSVGPLATNCYIAWCSQSLAGVVIDPGYESPKVLSRLLALGVKVGAVLLTHGHFDHATEAELVGQALAVPIMVSSHDDGLFHFSGLVTPLIQEQVIPLGEEALTVIGTPGHTRGSVCLHSARSQVLFSGDTLFNGGIGRTDLPGGSYRQIMESIRLRILVLPSETIVYPGHGTDTTVGEEAMAF